MIYSTWYTVTAKKISVYFPYTRTEKLLKKESLDTILKGLILNWERQVKEKTNECYRLSQDIVDSAFNLFGLTYFLRSLISGGKNKSSNYNFLERVLADFRALGLLWFLISQTMLFFIPYPSVTFSKAMWKLVSSLISHQFNLGMWLIIKLWTFLILIQAVTISF